MTDKKRILYDSPEAASVQTVTGWVSSRGMFCGNDEHMARHHGSTHRVCEKNLDHGEHETRGYCEVCAREGRAAHDTGAVGCQSIGVAVVADRVRLGPALDADRDAVIGLSRARRVKFQTPNVEYVRQAPLHVPKSSA